MLDLRLGTCKDVRIMDTLFRIAATLSAGERRGEWGGPVRTSIA
jgi:hypothetical protein